MTLEVDGQPVVRAERKKKPVLINFMKYFVPIVGLGSIRGITASFSQSKLNKMQKVIELRICWLFVKHSGLEYLQRNGIYSRDGYNQHYENNKR